MVPSYKFEQAHVVGAPHVVGVLRIQVVGGGRGWGSLCGRGRIVAHTPIGRRAVSPQGKGFLVLHINSFSTAV